MEDVRAASAEELDPTANGDPTTPSGDAEVPLFFADDVTQSHPVAVPTDTGTAPRAEALTAEQGEPDDALQPPVDVALHRPAELTATASTLTEPRTQAPDASAQPAPAPAGAEDDGATTPEPHDDVVAGTAPGPSDATEEPSEADHLHAEPSPVDEAEAEPDILTGEEPRPAQVGTGARPSRLKLLEREGEAAADFLERLLDIADLDGDIEVDIDGDRAAVAVVDSEEGRVPRRLVGPDGRVLEALQELTRLAVETVTGERSRLMLDVAGYRAQRRAALVELAKAAIAEVRQSGEDKALADMSAFERKVVHDEVTAAGLMSESEGVEPHRHIVISPR